MGLDITYYRNLQLQKAGEWGDDDPEPDIFLEGVAPYKDRMDSLIDGSYTGDEAGSFRAGSYGGYSSWRASLCRMANGIEPEVILENPENHNGKPFFELINFSDCEGAIGPATSAKLYKDFVAFDEQAQNWNDPIYPHDWFYNLYNEWKNAFKAASENGAVSFH